MRALLLDTVCSAWTNIVRLRTAGISSRDAHPAPMADYVIAGVRYHAQRDWRGSTGERSFTANPSRP